MNNLQKNRELIICKARQEDINGILTIQKEFLLGNKKSTKIQKKGFLVYPISKEELKKSINNPKNIILVAKGKEGIVGYALTYDLNKWKKNKSKWATGVTTSIEIKMHLSKDRILYFRHIARKEEYPGLGHKLEEKIYTLAKNQGYQSVIGEILEKPISNEKSKQIHEKRNFRKIGEVDYRDGNLWGLYEKILN